jgi:hypothetical protein
VGQAFRPDRKGIPESLPRIFCLQNKTYLPKTPIASIIKGCCCTEKIRKISGAKKDE